MRPNVIVFLTDQQRWDCSSLHGNPLDLMPNFDRLAHAGTHVEHSFTTQPVCGPARSCLQLGRYATNTGVWKNGLEPRRDLPSLAATFRDNGYTTQYVGKWHLYDHSPGDYGPVPEDARLGYERWLASNILEFTSDAYSTRLFDEDGAPHDLPGYRADACVDAAISRVAAMADEREPFFLFLSLIEPHHQNSRDDYPAPTGTRQRYESRWMPPDLAALSVPGSQGNAHQHLAGYYAMVRRLDEAFGRLMDALQSLGILEETIVLFTSDHGNHFKTRNAEYKRSCHDASVRVPTMLTGGPFTGGGTIRQLVSHIDLPATLLDACGLTVPESFEGSSILPLLRSQGVDQTTSPGQRRESVFIQISESETGRALRTGRWKYGVRVPGSELEERGYRQSHGETMQECFLYDLYADPYELNNLVAFDSHRAVRESLRSRLLDWIQTVEGYTPTITGPDRVVPGGQLSVSEHERSQ